LEKANEKYGLFTEVRGRGLMVGAELKPEYHGKAADFTNLAREHGVLMLVAGPNVLRFLPPLVISEKEMSKGLKRLDRAFKAFSEAKK
jgi:acetylornithine/N-succinyldiaminopimelate aminotransferase